MPVVETTAAAVEQLERRFETRRPQQQHKSRFKTLLLVTAVTLLNGFGNLSLAWGMKHAAVQVGLAPAGYVRDMLNPFVALGISLLILWLLTRMALLSWADLSYVLPVTSSGYFLSAVLGRIFLNEVITSEHWIGTLLIFAGVGIVGTTKHKTRVRPEAHR